MPGKYIIEGEVTFTIKNSSIMKTVTSEYVTGDTVVTMSVTVPVFYSDRDICNLINAALAGVTVASMFAEGTKTTIRHGD